MLTFKKVLLSVILFIFIVGGISFIVVTPYLNSHMDYNQDGDILNDMAGNIDFMVVGASHAMCSYVPQVLDEELGVVSYNFSTTLMPLSARYVMLEKELPRNPVKTVVLEVSYDNLQRSISEDYGWGENIMFSRLSTWEDRLSYLFKYVKPDQWLDIYSRTMNSGLTAWKDIFLSVDGKVANNTAPVNKGFFPRTSIDISMNEEKFEEIYQTKSCMMGFQKENLDLFRKIISLCHEYDAEVIIAISPCADSYIYKYDDLDEFDAWMKEFATENRCDFYNFNLIKDRFEIFNDKTSFWDGPHMSEQGARDFSKKFSALMKSAEAGENMSQFFYPNYEELTKNSPYYQYIE